MKSNLKVVQPPKPDNQELPKRFELRSRVQFQVPRRKLLVGMIVGRAAHDPMLYDIRLATGELVHHVEHGQISRILD